MSIALVVEPRKQQRKILSKLLEAEGLRVKSFDTAEEAAGQVARVAPNVMIVDVKMPSQSGLEALEQLRDRHFPVILITADETVAVKHDLYSLGDVVEAPALNQQVMAHIRGIVKRHSRHFQARPIVPPAQHSVASHVLPELHDPVTGRLDAGRITEFLGISLSSFAKLADISVGGLHKSPASVSLQPVLVPIARSLTILTQLLGTRERVRTWMNSPHPDLGGRTPISVVLEGKGRAVSDMLEASLAGQLS